MINVLNVFNKISKKKKKAIQILSIISLYYKWIIILSFYLNYISLNKIKTLTHIGITNIKV